MYDILSGPAACEFLSLLIVVWTVAVVNGGGSMWSCGIFEAVRRIFLSVGNVMGSLLIVW